MTTPNGTLPRLFESSGPDDGVTADSIKQGPNNVRLPLDVIPAEIDIRSITGLNINASGIVLTYVDISGTNVTRTVALTGNTFLQEVVQDVVGPMFTGNTGVTYDDNAGTITLPAGGGGAALGDTNPEPVSDEPAPGTATTGSRIDHQHRLNVNNLGDVRVTWDTDVITFHFNNYQLLSFLADLGGGGYSLRSNAIGNYFSTTKPTLAQARAATYANFYTNTLGYQQNRYIVVRLLKEDETYELDYGHIRLGGSDGSQTSGDLPPIELRDSQVIEHLGDSTDGTYALYAVLVADVPAIISFTLFVRELQELNLARLRLLPAGNGVLNRPSEDVIEFRKVADILRPDAVPATGLPASPPLRTAYRTNAVVNWDKFETATATQTGEIITIPIDLGGADGYDALVGYTTSYSGSGSAYLNGEMFLRAKLTSHTMPADLVVDFDGTEHQVADTIIDAGEPRLYAIPTIDPVPALVGTHQVRISSAANNSAFPADGSIGVAGEERWIVYVGENEWEYFYGTNEAWANQGNSTYIPSAKVGRTLTQAQYDALVAGSNTQEILYFIVG